MVNGPPALLDSFACHSAAFGCRASEHMSPKGAAHSIGPTSQTFKPSKTGMGKHVSNFVLSGHSWQALTMTMPRSGMIASKVFLFWWRAHIAVLAARNISRSPRGRICTAGKGPVLFKGETRQLTQWALATCVLLSVHGSASALCTAIRGAMATCDGTLGNSGRASCPSLASRATCACSCGRSAHPSGGRRGKRS